MVSDLVIDECLGLSELFPWSISSRLVQACTHKTSNELDTRVYESSYTSTKRNIDMNIYSNSLLFNVGRR